MRLIRDLLILTLYTLTYILVRLPLAPAVMPFLDIGEVMYHTLSLMEGRVPYRDDITHHFLGYTIEYLLAAKIFTFDEQLPSKVAIINQALSAFGIFKILTLLLPSWLALLGGLMLLLAGEPWVLGLYLQYQINLLAIYILYFSFLYLNKGALRDLLFSFLIAGVAFFFDQRAIVMLTVPFLAWWLAEKRKLKPLLIGLFAYLTVPTLALTYLFYHTALTSFIEQTLLFPILYRSASRQPLELLADIFASHLYLVKETPFLLAFFIVGLIPLFYRAIIRHDRNDRKDRLSLFVLLSIAPFILMPLFGSRPYYYYSVTWIPYMVLVGFMNAAEFVKLNLPKKSAYLLLSIAPIFLSLLTTINVLYHESPAHADDGINAVVSTMQSQMQPDDTVFIWGYRFDLYIYLHKLSPYPFANYHLIHPDWRITGEARLQHVYPKYESYFLELLNNKLPTYLVTFDRDATIGTDSLANQAVLQKIASAYDKILEINSINISGERVYWKGYRLRG